MPEIIGVNSTLKRLSQNMRNIIRIRNTCQTSPTFNKSQDWNIKAEKKKQTKNSPPPSPPPSPAPPSHPPQQELI